MLTGTLAVASEVAAADVHPVFVAGYGDRMDRISGSASNFAGGFSVPLTFRPRRLRGT